MTNEVLILFSLTALCCTNALPTNTKTASTEKLASTTTPNIDLLINPELITIENLESLLRQAGEIFLPASLQMVEAATSNQQQQTAKVPVPYQEMQPPTEQPYNFYLPIYEFDNAAKRDDKSRKLENFLPPAAPSKEQSINYYATKPKKLPKKFIGGSKHINLNWIMDLQKQAGGKEGDFTKAVYLVNDERNRINFDDSFFGVDMQVKTLDNEPYKASFKENKRKEVSASAFLNQGEELDEEEEEDDLVAAPTMLLAQVNFDKRHSEKKL